MTTHRTHRAEIELQVRGVALGRALHTRVGALHRERLAPLMDRVCSELSGPGQIDRIDTLELDLGRIPLSGFDEEFAARLEGALRSALANQLRGNSRQRTEAEASAELVECYARTGNLPWWADRSAPGLVAEHLRVLTRQARPIWQRLLHTFADDEVALARLVRVCDEAFAAELVVSAADAVLVADAGLLMDLLTSTIVAVDARHSRQLRTRLLQALGRGSPGELAAASAAMLATVPSAMLPRLADESAWRTASPALRQAVEQEADRRQAGSVDGSAQRSSLRTQRALARQLGLRVANPSDESTASATAPPELAADIEGPAGPPAAVAADGMRAPSLNSMNVVKYADALDHSTSLPTMPAEAMADTDHPAGATAPRLKLPNSKPVPAAHLPQRDSTAPRPSQADAARNAALRQRALARLEELQVEDAGLVILWPFIERCFALAGLLDKQRRFVDPQAQQQAVGLLAWLMFEEPEPAEYRLPLVKLLCGVPPEAPCAIDEPPPPAMCEQGLRMLAAVIEHAPALRRMQVPALRAAYLQRAGVLSVRAGMWLLRVERQPQDLLLDHFSWSWAWVALPWMTGPLQVEW